MTRLKYLLLALITILAWPLATKAQAPGGTTFVTGQVLDPNGNKYVNSQVNISFYDPGTSGKIPLLNGSTFQTQYTYQTDSFGNLPNIVPIALPDNGVIGSSSGELNTQWTFTIIYSDRVTSFSTKLTINCSTNTPATCSGSTINITAALQAAAAPLPGTTFGNISAGNITATGNLTVSGAATLNGTTLNCIANGVYYVNPGCFSGSDVGAQVNSAFTACHSGTIVTAYCKVVIPYISAGYGYTTTINLPVVTNVTLATLEIEPGTYLQYNGVGDAIAAIVGVSGASNPNVQIVGYGAILAAGNVHQGTGIHFKGLTSSNIYGLTVSSFKNGYWCDGSNSGNTYGTVLTQNLVGWRSEFETINGSPSACNNNSFHGGSILGNGIWGVMDDATNQTASQATFNTHNTFFGATIEQNGVTATAVNISTCSLSTGIVTLTTSTNINATVDGVVLISGSATGNGYFKILTSNGTNQLTYASSTNCTNSSGTAFYYTGDVFLEGGDSYLFSGVWFENGIANLKSYALVGDTNTISNHDDFTDDTTGDNNAVSVVDNVNGQGTLLVGFRVPFATITNLVNNGAAATGLYIDEPRGSFTNTCAGTCTNATISLIKNAGGLAVGGAPNGSSGDVQASRGTNSGAFQWGSDGNCAATRQATPNLVFASGCGPVDFGASIGVTGTIQNGTNTATMGLTLKKGSGGGNYTNATTSYTVADSTNLCFTVTIPTGWKLGISASGALSTATAAVVAQAALTDNASCSTANAGIIVETAPIQGSAIGVADAFALNWVITGDGASHNIAMQFKTSNAADTASLINSSATLTPTMKFTLMPSN